MLGPHNRDCNRTGLHLRGIFRETTARDHDDGLIKLSGRARPDRRKWPPNRSPPAA